MENEEKQFDRIVITGVPKKVKNKVERIAAKKGITVSAYLKPKLNDFIEEEERRMFPKG
jgi:hypothetical protein